MLLIKLIALFLILGVTLLGGFYPFAKKIKTSKGHEFPAADAFASGVFLGAGLLHMLPDAMASFAEQQFEYPLACLVAGATFLLLLWFEHIGTELYSHEHGESPSFAILATLMFSVHSLFAGAALGLSNSYTIVFTILFAILAHKWIASFALAVYINRSSISTRLGLILFGTFAAMVPLGILLGNGVTHYLEHHTLLEPIFASAAAGTFLYMGTLHRLKHAVMIDKCCDLRRFSAVVVGFAIMAAVAIWA